jgi:ankyrin repeat domain-containing protein 50
MGVLSKITCGLLGKSKKKPDSGAKRGGGGSSSATTPNVDPWTRAYKIVQEREDRLMADYNVHLASLQGDAVASADLSTSRSVESIVKKLSEDREQKQWRVSLLDHDIKIRTQVERLTKFLLWSDPIVKTAISAQPHAALAWSGVSLLLPVGK